MLHDHCTVMQLSADWLLSLTCITSKQWSHRCRNYLNYLKQTSLKSQLTDLYTILPTTADTTCPNILGNYTTAGLVPFSLNLNMFYFGALDSHYYNLFLVTGTAGKEKCQCCCYYLLNPYQSNFCQSQQSAVVWGWLHHFQSTYSTRMYTLKYAQVQLRMTIYTLIQLLPHVSTTLWRSFGTVQRTGTRSCCLLIIRSIMHQSVGFPTDDSHRLKHILNVISSFKKTDVLWEYVCLSKDI